MNDEIKEIKIDKNAKSIFFINNGIAFSQFGVADDILDCITNLQQELEDYKSRIEKAVEYIENEDIDVCTIKYNDIYDTKQELLNILNGRSDE